MASRSEIITSIRKVIDEYSQIKLSYGEARYQKIMDDEQGIYQLKLLGWDGSTQIYGIVFDFEVISDKVWIHFDGTESGIALRLEELGIPKKQIILGWLPLSQRKHSGYGVT